jgi:hypothetical protein
LDDIASNAIEVRPEPAQLARLQYQPPGRATGSAAPSLMRPNSGAGALHSPRGRRCAVFLPQRLFIG